MIAALLCVLGAGLGALFILYGVATINLAYGPRSIPFLRAGDLFKGGLASLIGLLMTGFSIRWFLIAVRLWPPHSRNDRP